MHVHTRAQDNDEVQRTLEGQLRAVLEQLRIKTMEADDFRSLTPHLRARARAHAHARKQI